MNHLSAATILVENIVNNPTNIYFQDFPVRPMPFEGESVAGFLYRFLSENGHKILAPGYQLLRDLYCGSHSNSHVAFEILSKAFGEAAKFDREWWVTQRLDAFPAYGRRQAWLELNFRRVGFCPDCLTENDFHLLLWELPLIRACPFHETYLIWKCIHCQRKFSWNRLDTDWKCNCGASIKNMKAEKASPASVYFANLLSYVLPTNREHQLKFERGTQSYRYSLRDVYDSCAWAMELRKILRLRAQTSNRGRRRRNHHPLTIKVAADNWHARFLYHLSTGLVGKIQSVLLVNRRLCQTRLIVKPSDLFYRLLVESKSFEAGRHIFSGKLHEQINTFVSRHERSIPIPALVLYWLNWPDTDQDIYFSKFAEWMPKFSRVALSVQTTEQTNCLYISDHSDVAVKVLEIVKMLIDGAFHGRDPRQYRALGVHWSIPVKMQWKQSPQNTFIGVTTNLCTMSLARLNAIQEILLEVSMIDGHDQ